MSDIRTKIQTALTNVGAPAQELKRPDAFPGISYDISDRPALHADGVEAETEYTVQIDVWTKTDYKTIAAAVNAGMKAQGFVRYDSAGLYDSETNTYQKALRYRITMPV